MARKHKHITELSEDSARDLAVNALQAFARQQSRIQDHLDARFRGDDWPDRERRLATELACGACRRLITLDHLLAKHSSRTLRHVAPIVLDILRVGLYQMLYLAGTPDFAAVNEAVQQARRTGIRGVDSFVNAVLRGVQRALLETAPERPDPRRTLLIGPEAACYFEAPCLPDPARKPAKYLSVVYGLPLWLIERWLKRMDFAAAADLARACNGRPPLTVRVNRLRTTPDALAQQWRAAGHEFLAQGDALQLTGPAAVERLPGYPEGLFCVQDPTAMGAAALLAPAPGDAVLDLCAAPGGKTTHLAELMGNRGRIVACDLTAAKLALVEQNCIRLGIDIVTRVRADQLDTAATADSFDAVLLDVPCSNTGVLARRVEARHWLKPVTLQRLKADQAALLDRAAALLRPGGRLLYSTCSIEPAENDEQVAAFLQRRGDYQLTRATLTLPTSDASTGLRHDGGYLALLSRD